MVKKSKLSIDLKRDENGYAFVEAQKCGECGHIQKAGEIDQINKDTFLTMSTCERCQSTIVTAFGDRNLLEEFMMEIQQGIKPKSM